MKQFTIEAMFETTTQVKTYEAKSKVEALRNAMKDGALAIKNIEIA